MMLMMGQHLEWMYIFVNYYYIAILSYNNMKILCNDINNKIYNNKILNNIKYGNFNNNILTNMD